MPDSLTVEESPLEMLLQEQSSLQTPVGQFSEQHASLATQSKASFYQQLLPISKPKAGEQYAFKVELDKCTGCKACVSACHSLNGLDEDETWRDVGTLSGGCGDQAYTQTVTTACHHCVDPACLNGCPVLAYEKDEDTGIVRHLDDQCIGCQYCVLKCPYDVPKYSKKLGIVRKCDLCHSRLAVGEAPACAQACPTEAISVQIVNQAEQMSAARNGGDFLAAAPDPAYTVPTTHYVSQRTLPEDVHALNQHALRPEPTHWPLVWMLLLTQMAAGLFLFDWLFQGPQVLPLLAWSLLLLGLIASTTHLGRPLGAWRAFLGLRRSWLSREIAVFSIFFFFASVYVASLLWPQGFSGLTGYLSLATTLSGFAGVYCSIMIYVDTQRPFWAGLPTSLRFGGSSLLFGLLAIGLSRLLSGESVQWIAGLTWLLMLFKLGYEANQVWGPHSQAAKMTPAKKSAALMRGPLQAILHLRFASAIGFMLLLAPFCFGAQWLLGMGALVLLLLITEFSERVLFFRAVAAPKMPGSIDS